MLHVNGHVNQPFNVGEELPAGIYILQVVNGSKINYQRILKK
jgi:hypothetical protein